MKINCDPFIIWLFGIPGAGKSTLAKKISQKLSIPNEILDSDDLRERITPNPTWSDGERFLFYNTIVEISIRLFKHNVSTIIAASAGGVYMDNFRNSFPPRTFYIYLDCEIINASKRHPKALYSLAKGSEIRLPIIRSTIQGKADEHDIEYAKSNNIKAYRLIIPEKIDLIIDTNHKADLDSNVKSIIALIN